MEQRLKRWPHLPLVEGTRVINAQVTGEDQELLTKQYTQRAVDFITTHKDEPFFVYVPHSMVHVPLYVSDEFKGKSGAGLFGDVVMEVDWSMGMILETLKKHDLEENTLVIFTTDNGPWLSYGDHAGSAAPLREGKGTMFEVRLSSSNANEMGRQDPGGFHVRRISIDHRHLTNHRQAHRCQASRPSNRWKRYSFTYVCRR